MEGKETDIEKEMQEVREKLEHIQERLKNLQEQKEELEQTARESPLMESVLIKIEKGIHNEDFPHILGRKGKRIRSFFRLMGLEDQIIKHGKEKLTPEERDFYIKLTEKYHDVVTNMSIYALRQISLMDKLEELKEIKELEGG